MRTLALTLLIAATSLTAFSQGKVNLFNDMASLVMIRGTDAVYVYPADAPLAGQPIGNSNPLPSGAVLMAGLWGGTSQNSLHLYSTFTMNNAAPGSAGVIGPLHIVLNSSTALDPTAPNIPGIPNASPIGPSTPWFQVRVWDESAGYGPGGFQTALAELRYAGQGQMFQMNPGSSIAYVNTSPGVNSTWVDGPIYPYTLIPEPSSFALVGLGAGVLIMFRWRKGSRD